MWRDEENCCLCGRTLIPNRKNRELLGLSCETGEYTLDEKEATQGFFPVGSSCLKKWKKGVKTVI